MNEFIATRQADHRVALLNGCIDPLTMDETINRATDLLDAGRRGWLCTVNVSNLMAMRKDVTLRRFIEKAAICVADGQPLVWLARRKKTPLPQRVTGVDMVEALAARAAEKQWGMYLLGARPEVAQRLGEVLLHRYPSLMVSAADGYFSAAEEAERVREIRDSGARVLLVAMGTPRQEEFISRNWNDLGVGLAIPVGGSFDVLAGLRYRAPLWMQRIGMEWAFRLAQEPRRLWKRYLISNTQFIWLAGRELLRREI